MSEKTGIACEEGEYENFTGIIMWGDNEGVVENADFKLDTRFLTKSLSMLAKPNNEKRITFRKGIWENGIWKDGIWNSGYWNFGEWKNGTWHDGYWRGSTWEDGKWVTGKDKNDAEHKISPDKWGK